MRIRIKTRALPNRLTWEYVKPGVMLKCTTDAHGRKIGSLYRVKEIIEPDYEATGPNAIIKVIWGNGGFLLEDGGKFQRHELNLHWKLPWEEIEEEVG